MNSTMIDALNVVFSLNGFSVTIRLICVFNMPFMINPRWCKLSLSHSLMYYFYTQNQKILEAETLVN